MNFNHAVFSGEAYFGQAEFKGRATFVHTIFKEKADFSQAKFSETIEFDSTKFNQVANFISATFSAKAYFSSATFSAGVHFGGATFSADAYFISATFSADAYFNSAEFSASAYFSSATFLADAVFISATFSADAYFGSTKFLETSEVFFRRTKICKTIGFNYTVFAGYVAFEGNRDEKVFLDKKEEDQDAILDLQSARLEKPERISFHRIRLCPSWFVNTDPRKMIFTDVNWDNLDAKFRNANIKVEIENLEEQNVSEPSRLLEIAYRQLAVNAEENNRYEEAAKFRYMAMETKRLEYKWQGRLWSLNWWYKWTSSYGEDWKWATVVLLAILFTFAFLYTQTNFQVCPVEKTEPPTPCETRPLYFGEAARHSLATAAFQNVEYRKPSSGPSETFIILEKIFAPLQAALLALAIRRKFMR